MVVLMERDVMMLGQLLMHLRHCKLRRRHSSGHCPPLRREPRDQRRHRHTGETHRRKVCTQQQPGLLRSEMDVEKVGEGARAACNAEDEEA